jgi:hypothetical protein
VASGDTAAAVSQRFSGGVKDGSHWRWKDLKFSGDGPINTQGAVPSPWRKGLTVFLPDSWSVDLGPMSGATGSVVNAPRVHGDDELGCNGVEGTERDELAGEVTDGAEDV